MKLTMTVRDCLYLNWALPVEALPEPPAPLRYQLHSWGGQDWVFASALLFHQDAVRLAALPLIRVGYPQFNLRFYVLDREGTPSVLFRRMLMPGWVAPGVRLMSHQPAFSARLDFPRPTADAGDGPWVWRVEHGGTLEVKAWRDMSAVSAGSAGAGSGEGPRLGSWDDTVRYFQMRLRGYAQNSDGRLHRMDVRKQSAVAWPLRAEVAGAELLPDLFCLPSAGSGGSGGSGGMAWPPLHSAWLCPEVPFAFELGLAPKEVGTVSRSGMPQPAAGRVAEGRRASC